MLLPVRFGGTGLTVTPLGLGLAAVGRPGYIDLGRDEDLPAERPVDVMEARTHALLDAAVAAGVRYVDAARSYGNAEAFLASWLAAHDGSSLTVGSKWGYTYVADWRVDADVHEVKDHSLATFERQWAETRSLLGEHVDVYQIHSATLESGVLDDPAVLDALRSRRERGVVVGLSTSGSGQGDTIRRALALDDPPFASVQATWNLLEPSAGPALAEAHAAGWGVIVKEVVANGRLGPRASGPEAAALRAVAARTGHGFDQLAIAAALAQPWRDVVLSGAATTAQLASHVEAISIELGDDDLAELSALAEPPGRYWQTRSALPWT